MKPADNLERTIKKDLNFSAGAELHDRMLNDVLKAQEKSRKANSAVTRPNLRRIIMKSPFTKLVTAAAVVLAVVLSITLINQTATPAWAIEQTIEALNNVKTVHLSGYAKYPDQPRQVFEIWAMPSSADESVSGNFRLTEADRHISIANEKENITYVYTRNLKGDVVYITEGLNRGCNPFPTSNLFKQLKEIGRNWKETYGKDVETGRDCVFVTLVGPSVNTACYWKLQFDVETKLPLRAGVWWDENYKGEPHFDYTSIEYGGDLPEGCFDFNIPEGTQVVDCRQLRTRLDDNANCGVLVTNMNTADACRKVVEEYWQAVINNNWQDINRIRPLAAGNDLEKLRALYNENQPVELVNIAGMNHLEDPGTFAEVTCVVKMKDGVTKQSVLNVEITQVPQGRAGVIAGSIRGELTEIK